MYIGTEKYHVSTKSYPIKKTQPLCCQSEEGWTLCI